MEINDDNFENVILEDEPIPQTPQAAESDIPSEVDSTDSDSAITDIPIVEPVEETPEPKIERRGGKRKGSGRKADTDKKKDEEPEPESDPVEEIADDINGGAKSEFNPDDYEPIIIKADTEEKKEYKAFLTGMMLLMVLNLFIPSIALKLMGAISEKYAKIKPDEITLDDKQLAMLEECANEVAADIFKQLPPIAQLGLGFTIMTVGNIMVKAKTDEVPL